MKGKDCLELSTCIKNGPFIDEQFNSHFFSGKESICQR